MLLIKYDGITNVLDAISKWKIDCSNLAGNSIAGLYFVKNDKLEFTVKYNFSHLNHIIYKSSEVANWNSRNILSLPKEILDEVKKRNTSYNLEDNLPLERYFTFSIQPEGFSFWDTIAKNKFYKFFETYNISKIENDEIKLSNKESSIIRGAEPKGRIVRDKKGLVSIASGFIEYGRISRGK